MRYLTLSLIVLLFIAFNLEVQAQRRKRTSSTISGSSKPIQDLGIANLNLNLRVQDASLLTPIPALVYIYKQGQDSLILSRQLDDKPSLIIQSLSINEVYTIQISAPEYKDTTYRISFIEVKDYDLEHNIPLEPIRKDFTISVRDAYTGANIPEGIILKNQNKKKEQLIYGSDHLEDGVYKVQIRAKDPYELIVKSSNAYAFYYQLINQDTSEKEHAVKLIPLKVGAKIRLNNISFEYGSDQLNQNSLNELNEVLDLLLKQPSLKLEVAAYTDSIGSAKTNLILSEKRAQQVFTYLVGKGIQADRLIPKGYGEANPIASNATEEGRAINRRFELIIKEV